MAKIPELPAGYEAEIDVAVDGTMKIKLVPQKAPTFPVVFAGPHVVPLGLEPVNPDLTIHEQAPAPPVEPPIMETPALAPFAPAPPVVPAPVESSVKVEVTSFERAFMKVMGSASWSTGAIAREIYGKNESSNRSKANSVLKRMLSRSLVGRDNEGRWSVVGNVTVEQPAGTNGVPVPPKKDRFSRGLLSERIIALLAENGTMKLGKLAKSIYGTNTPKTRHRIGNATSPLVNAGKLERLRYAQYRLKGVQTNPVSPVPSSEETKTAPTGPRLIDSLPEVKKVLTAFPGSTAEEVALLVFGGGEGKPKSNALNLLSLMRLKKLVTMEDGKWSLVPETTTT